MDALKKYTIAHKGLNIGNHDFEFKVDDHLFEAFEESEIRRGEGVVKISLKKQSNLLTLDFDIEASVEVVCDRCLELFELPVSYQGTLYVRYSESEQESDGEILWISPNETELPLGKYIYESICLTLPYQRIHPENEQGVSLCNPEMLARFQIVSEEEFEKIAKTDEGESPWAKLEELKHKLENK